MAKAIPTTQLAQRIEKLLEDRQRHADALASIDAALAGVAASLAGAAVKPGKPTGVPAAVAASPVKRGRRRRRSRKYGMTSEESVLTFIRSNRNPTTQEIKKHYLSEGRGGTVDNVLSKLFREKRVLREPLVGQRGSRYLLP